MITQTRKVYFCEHCKKNGISASVISRHEKYCRHNPHNKHKCFDMCIYLERIRKFNGSFNVTEFNCTKKGQGMYSYLIEKKASLWPYSKLIKEGLMRMPLTCTEYQEMSFDEQEERYYKDEPENY